MDKKLFINYISKNNVSNVHSSYFFYLFATGYYVYSLVNSPPSDPFYSFVLQKNFVFFCAMKPAVRQFYNRTSL